MKSNSNSTSTFWDSYKLIKEVGKNDKGDVIRVSHVTLKNKEYIDVRTYFISKTTNKLTPGKGIAIPIELADEVALAIMDTVDDKEVSEDDF